MKRVSTLWIVSGALCLVSCGAALPPAQRLASLRQALDGDVPSREVSAEHSRVVEATLDDNALNGLRRDEVQEILGRGEPCSRHPRCAQHDFQDNDWFYEVGHSAEGYGSALPLLILGFDRAGRVSRVWNLRTH